MDPDAIERQIRVDLPGNGCTDHYYARLAQEEVTRRRTEYAAQGIAFSFETVLSDPCGDKLDFLRTASHHGHYVALLAIGLESAEKSAARVALRVSRGGHDVPGEKIISRYPRVLANLHQAVTTLPLVLLVDNSVDNPAEDGDTFHAFALYENGSSVAINNPPAWWTPGTG